MRAGRPLAVVAALVIAVTGLTVAGSSAPTQAQPGDGIITVIVDRDFSGDGLYDAGVDRPQKGIDVSVTDAAGTTVDGTTDDAGQVIIPDSSTLTGSKYLVETSIPTTLNYLQAAPAASGPNAYRSVTTFVDVSGGPQTVRVGVWNPTDYAPVNPDYVMAIQPAPDHPGPGRTLVRTSWSNRGDGNGSEISSNTQDVATIATPAQTGSIFGTAWSLRNGHVFSAAFAKAFVPYGAAGPGAIYVTDPNSAAPNAVLYATIPNAGTTAHALNSGMTGKDDPFFGASGAESLGGIALSADDSTLYVVNMADKRLYEVDATSAPGNNPTMTSVDTDSPQCTGGVWRPGAVTVRDGVVYVGGVCDASISMDRGDLAAYVLRLNGTTFSTVLEQPLDFQRGRALSSSAQISRQWNPWINTWSETTVENWTPDTPTSQVNVLYPTPLLTSLEFDTDGSLFLGFRDRFADQLGREGLEPGDGTTNGVGTISAGDLNKACVNPDGSYSWEGTNGCPSNAQSFDNGDQDPAVNEFFEGDWSTIDGILGNHQEIAQGGISFAPRNGEVASSAMDMTGFLNSGGVGFFDVTTGEGPGGNTATKALLVTAEPETFGKGNGLGDLDVIAAAAPVQIGNRVWYDKDKDGAQGPAEPSLPGATVSLVDGSGTVVATTTTNADGEYYFGGDGALYQLESGADYTVRFDVGTADTSGIHGTPPANTLTYTAVGAAGDSTLDSDATPTGSPGIAEAPVTAPSVAGAVDHRIDAGVYANLPSVSVGNLVWVDQNGNGVQDSGEPGIQGVVLTVTGPNGQPVTDVNGDSVGPVTTDASGVYTFDQLPVLQTGESYKVTIDRNASATALQPYVPTRTGAGTSATDSSTWAVSSVDLTADGDNDDTLDFGFMLAPQSSTTATLPFTGAAVTFLSIGLAAAALLAGAGLVVAGRRRRQPKH